MASVIQNDYLQATIFNKYWTILGIEFGPELQVCKAYRVRALYGTHCDGRDFRQHLRECIEMLGYTSCLEDPDLWIRKAVNDNGYDYYEYMLLYVDDYLCIFGCQIEAL